MGADEKRSSRRIPQSVYDRSILATAKLVDSSIALVHSRDGIVLFVGSRVNGGNGRKTVSGASSHRACVQANRVDKVLDLGGLHLVRNPRQYCAAVERI